MRRTMSGAMTAALLLGTLGGAPPATAEGGTVATVAGKSPAGFSGDGGPANDAQMHEPRMMTFAPSGDMYIADTFNQLIRKVDTAGTITTVAGKFTGFVPRDEADCVENFNGDGGPATEATLSCPHGVAVDTAGNVYIADSANHVIRRVDPSGTIVTVAGAGGTTGDSGDGGPGTEAHIQGPKGIVLDGRGGLLIADSGNDRVKRLDLDSGILTLVAGTGDQGNAGDGGPATEAQLVEPRTLAVGPDGSVFIAEPKAHRVRRVDPPASSPRSRGRAGPASRATADRPVRPSSTFPAGWAPTQSATCTSPIP